MPRASIRNNPRMNQILEEFTVDQEREAALLIQYTLFVNRELVFAVDLMSFVMTKRRISVQHCPYIFHFDRCGITSDFDNQTKRFVELIMTIPGRGSGVVEEYLEQGRVDYEEFKSLLHAMTFEAEEKLVPGNWTCNTYNFLLLSIMIAEICSSAYWNNMWKAPRFGIMFICRTFLHFVNVSILSPDDPWNAINIFALSQSSFS